MGKCKHCKNEFSLTENNSCFNNIVERKHSSLVWRQSGGDRGCGQHSYEDGQYMCLKCSNYPNSPGCIITYGNHEK